MDGSGNPVVLTKQGKVQGTIKRNVYDGDFLIFEGIPFAQPPIGELRFKDPLPAKPWDGIFILKSGDHKPAQYDSISQEFSGTEDCLYLNVATNSLNDKRPVMVWFPGGGFNWGSASTKLYGPDYLLKKDIVFVAIAYRLGCFGYLNLDLPEAPGNQGMKDQVMGLKWIQENIEAFGGDPKNVTIFGSSAGGASVHLLNMSPLAKGLFHKAIIQSSVAINPWTFSDNPTKAGLRLAAILANKSINDPEEALKILRQATTDEVLKAGRQMHSRDMVFDGVFDFVPSVDSKTYPRAFMPKHPRELAKNGIHVPLIIGCNTEEGMYNAVGHYLDATFQDLNTDFSAYVARGLGISDVRRISTITKKMKEYYHGDVELLTITNNIYPHIQMIGDIQFYFGVRQTIEFQSNVSTPTYVYLFSHRPSYPTMCRYLNRGFEGTGHGDEIGALFYTTGQKILRKGSKDYLVMQKLTQMWTNFAKTGNPTPKVDEILPTKWEPITHNKINCLNISEELVPSSNFQEATWNFWKPIFETL